MKKILSLLGAITLIGTSSTNLVACNKSNEYSAEKLKELKEKNKINTKDKTIRDNLEWMASQETPFNKVDNKYYYVVWKTNKLNITKFKNDVQIKMGHMRRIIEELKDVKAYCLKLLLYTQNVNLLVRSDGSIKIWDSFKKLEKTYIKSVYRWNLDIKEPNLILDKDGNLKVNGE